MNSRNAQPELAWCYNVSSKTGSGLDEHDLRALQLKRLNHTLCWARANCSYYQALYPATEMKSLQEIESLPFVDAAALSNNFEQLLCMSPAEVGRIVTLPTSGTTGTPKRIAFSPKDHKFMVEYLAAGMRMLTPPGETIMVLFPCNSGGGLGELICESIELAGRRAVPHGIPQNFTELAKCIWRKDVRAAVGFPQHLLAFVRWSKLHGHEFNIDSLLLSADNVSRSLSDALAGLLGAPVFTHFGMTETGYGGAVECPLHVGLHVRESDLLVEIIDPITGQVLPSGEWGELVFTTLTREALPLIRYRSGDKARIIAEACECGSILKRLDYPQGRLDEQVAVLQGATITMPELEECLFALPQLVDFEASYSSSNEQLDLRIATFEQGALAKQQILITINEMFKQKHVAVLDPQSSSLNVSIEQIEDFKPYYPAKRFIKLLG